MSSNYSIISERTKNDWIFHVKENHTNQILKTFDKKVDARRMYKRAKSGGIFNGWSPFFMFNKDFERVYKKLFQGENK